MVKPADLRNRDYLAAVWRLDGASFRAVFVERQMGPRAVIIIDVREQDAAQMTFVDHNYMVQTLAANRSDGECRKFRVREPYNEARRAGRKVWQRTRETG